MNLTADFPAALLLRSRISMKENVWSHAVKNLKAHIGDDEGHSSIFRQSATSSFDLEIQTQQVT